MKKFKRFITKLMVLALVIGTFAAVPSRKAKADEAPKVEGNGLEDGKIWINGKDKKDKTDDTKSKYYKTETFTHIGMFSGGKWNVLVTTTDIDETSFKDCFGDKAKVNKSAAGVAGAAKSATAKIKEGVVTITSGKELATVQEGGDPNRIRVWVYETKKVGKTVKVVGLAGDTDPYTVEGVKPEYRDFDLFLAPKKIIVSKTEFKTGYAGATKSETTIEMTEDSHLRVYIAPDGNAAAPNASYTLEGEGLSASNATEGIGTLKAIDFNANAGTGTEKGKKYTYTLTCNESQAKTKIVIIVKSKKE